MTKLDIDHLKSLTPEQLEYLFALVMEAVEAHARVAGFEEDIDGLTDASRDLKLDPRIFKRLVTKASRMKEPLTFDELVAAVLKDIENQN